MYFQGRAERNLNNKSPQQSEQCCRKGWEFQQTETADFVSIMLHVNDVKEKISTDRNDLELELQENAFCGIETT